MSSKLPHVVQFTVFLENKVGQLHELTTLLNTNGLHIMAICLMDTIDTIIARLIINYPEPARDLFLRNNIYFKEKPVIVVTAEGDDYLKRITCAFLQAEANVYYMYPFLICPGGKPALAIRCEAADLAEDVLTKNRLTVLHQGDIAR